MRFVSATARMRVVALACAGVLAALLAAAPARATTLECLSVEQMSAAAQRVVVGRVDSVVSEPTADGARTAVRIAVTESLKGDATGVTTVYVPGGDLGDGTLLRVADMARFTRGETVCVFADDRGWVMGGYQGKVGLADGATSSGEPLSALRARVVAGIAGKAAAVPPPSVSAQGGLSALVAPTILTVSPDAAPAGIGAQITIQGTGFGATPGKVTFYYVKDKAAMPAAITSWSDTRIVCDVPVNDEDYGYSASAGSGPMIVTTAGGSASAPYEFKVLFGYGGAKWPGTSLTYRVNPAGGPVSGHGLIDAAAGVWNAAGSGLTLVDGGPASDTGLGNLRNDLMWAGVAQKGAIALTWTISRGGEVLECDVQLSTAYTWGDGTGGTMDVESIAIHELGHWLTLRDLYGPGDAAKCMYGFASPGSVKRTLDAGDATGIRWIYGAVPGGDTSPTAITIGSSASRVALPKPFILSGTLVPGELGDAVVVEVRRPGSVRWSYSSRRLVYTSAGGWWYRYTPRVRGTYAFRARFGGAGDRLASLSRTVYVGAR